MKHKILLLIVFLRITLYAQFGCLDNSFGIGGKVTTDFVGSFDECRSIAIQIDGKILVAGYSKNDSLAADFDFALARYNSDGTLDNTFDFDGKVTTDFGNNHNVGNSVAIQSDGKIIVVGNTSNSIDGDFGIVRYNNNGSIDTSFGFGGKVTTDFGGTNDCPFSICQQPDGKIVVAGCSGNYPMLDFALVRYNPNGIVDSTFATNGRTTTDFEGYYDQGFSVALQNDGKIVVAGKTTKNGSNINFALVRYNSDGSLDNTFDSDGKVITDFAGFDDEAFSLALQNDGKIVVAGTSDNYSDSSDYDFAVARYTSNGILDSTFNFNGRVTTDFGNSGDISRSLAILISGKIVLAGYSAYGPDANFALVSYNSDGSLDNTFDSDGKVTTDFGSIKDLGYSATIQDDGKIIVAGMSYNGSDYDFALARYNSGTNGVSENTEMSIVSIYPNPSSGIVAIYMHDVSSSAKLTVHDVLGNCLLEKTCQGGNIEEINLSGQPKGIYSMEIVSDGERVVKKIVLQ